ncbi:hypothetical protein F8M41_025584 [Gigaspora margarita]|uniref:Uncharacterized protein n=1 Tax=Gigaspora margarita TaxID=4874 RepID=A0A8H3XL06_GIGMA|nr:hypothetical protein F8M41_025584 [Gigaspora margarita]
MLVIVIDQHEWASALDGYGPITHGKHCESINIIGCPGLSKVICDNTPHSPEKIIEQAKKSFCMNQECREVAYYNGYCNKHRKIVVKKKDLSEQKREEIYQNYLDRLLDAQKQSDQQVSLQIQLGMKEEECLTKKLGDEKIQTLCQTQIELTKLEKDLVKLEEIINLSLN